MSEPRGRPFAPGNTLGRGRPKGSRNKAGSPGQELLDEYATKLVAKCITRASQGDGNALRLCIERILPRRGASVRISLPGIRTAEDLEKAAEKVTQHIARGRISPADGERMMNIFQMRSGFIDSVQLHRRVAEVEEKLAAASAFPRAA